MIIIAKYNGKCSETGKRISIGESIFWSKSTGKVYCKDSEKYKDAHEARNISAYVQSQEDAYYDRFSYDNR